MQTFRFLNFSVYQASKLFYSYCVHTSKSFPRLYWELADQLRRAALSVTLNIAEGSAKGSDKDFNRYIEISLGSINECLACCDIAVDHKLITTEQFDTMRQHAEIIAKQLGGFSKQLRKMK